MEMFLGGWALMVGVGMFPGTLPATRLVAMTRGLWAEEDLAEVVPVPTDQTVSCIVPGHERPGTELYAEEVVVEDPPFAFELHGTCAFTRDFEYRG
jgi:hypothetical protein